MTPKELVESLYLGDRACKAFHFDAWQHEIAIQIDLISRLKPGTEKWDHWTGGDIENGWIVFTEASFCNFDPSGPIPDDAIEFTDVQVRDVDGERIFMFHLTISAGVGKHAELVSVNVRIDAKGVYLRDSSGSRILSAE